MVRSWAPSLEKAVEKVVGEVVEEIGGRTKGGGTCWMTGTGCWNASASIPFQDSSDVAGETGREGPGVDEGRVWESKVKASGGLAG
jgi:hypothetical protein